MTSHWHAKVLDPTVKREKKTVKMMCKKGKMTIKVSLMTFIMSLSRNFHVP